MSVINLELNVPQEPVIEVINDSPYRCHYTTSRGSICCFFAKYKMDEAWYCQKHLVMSYNNFYNPDLSNKKTFRDLLPQISMDGKQRSLPHTFLVIPKRHFEFSYNTKKKYSLRLNSSLFVSICIYKMFHKLDDKEDEDRKNVIINDIRQSINRQIKGRNMGNGLTDYELQYILSNVVETNYLFEPVFKSHGQKQEQQQEKQEEEICCSVCLDDIRFEGTRSVLKTNCNHLFHSNCILKWFNKRNTTCPCCRETLIKS